MTKGRKIIKSESSKAILTVGIVALALLAVWQLSGFFGFLAGKEETLKMQVTVTYTDGTSEVIESTGHIGSTMALVKPGGGTVSSITVRLLATPTFTGQVSDYSVSGKVRMRIEYVNPQLGNIPVFDTGDLDITPSGHPTLVSGQDVEISRATDSANDLEALIPSNYKVSGNLFDFKYICSAFSMTIKFADGNQETRSISGSVIATLRLQYQSSSQFTGLSVRFDVTS